MSENDSVCLVALQVNDLRKELDCRSLSSKGLKSQLIARLTKQLKVEEQVEESKEPDQPESKIPEEEEPSRTEEEREVNGFTFLSISVWMCRPQSLVLQPTVKKNQ